MNYVETDDDNIVLYHQVLNHVRVISGRSALVLVVDSKHDRRVVFFSTDVDLDALTIYRMYKAIVSMISIRYRQNNVPVFIML